MSDLSLDQKRALARRLLLEKQQRASSTPAQASYEDFMSETDRQLSEVSEFSQWLEQSGFRRSSGLVRSRVEQAGDRVTFHGETAKPALNFATYNYLGLGAHPRVVEKAKAALDQYGIGCGASAVAGGQLHLHHELRHELVQFFELPNSDALLFSAGYNANTGTLSALMRPGCHVVLDSLVHMSLLEGARLSGATIHTFRHNDATDLARVLESLLEQKNRILVCTEGVYSADGDFGKLADIADTAKRYGALFLVDEAHSVLLCGPQGRGVAAQQKVLDKVDLLILTFSKGFGGVGGAVIAKRSIVEYLHWYARSHVFSCALSPAVTAGVLEALRIAKGPEGAVRRKRLQAQAESFRQILGSDFQLCGSESWIVPVLFGPESRTLALSPYLIEQGLETSLMQYPAVPKGEARLRLFVSSEHSPEQLKQAADILREAAQRFNFPKPG